MDEIHVPPCPRCGDPVIVGCYPDDGICWTDESGALAKTWRVALAWVQWVAGRIGYAVRPYDMLADRRRWFWRPRQRCGWSRGVGRDT